MVLAITAKRTLIAAELHVMNTAGYILPGCERYEEFDVAFHFRLL
jgi:hypothetical protein